MPATAGTRVVSLPNGPPVRHNRWRDAAEPLPAGWTPHRTVTIVIPAYNAENTLDLTLASLAAQDYPAELLEVVVVDDGSTTPYRVPELRPTNTRVITPDSGWGRANACDTGARAGTGELILWLDADLVLPRGHVRAHAEMHDRVHDAATKGDLRFVATWDLTPDQVFQSVTEGALSTLFDPDETLERQWTEDVYRRTDDLNDAGPYRFTILTGASAMVSRAMYLEGGGLDTELRLGEDSEFAYRLAQLGAVFVPVRTAPGYHLGPSNTQVRDDAVRRYDSPHFARRAPQIMGRRTSRGRQWEVPKVVAVVDVTAETARYARACVDRLLAGTEEDLAVILVGPWDTLHAERRRVLDDPTTEMYLVREWYHGEGRVTLATERPTSAFPSPFLLDVPVTAGVGDRSVEDLLRQLDKRKAGLVSVPFVGHQEQETLRLFRTAALSRALRHQADGESLAKAIERVWGSWTLDPQPLELEDLTGDVDLAAPVGRRRLTARDEQRMVRLEKQLATAQKRLRRARKNGPRESRRASSPPSVRGSLRLIRRDLAALARAVKRKLLRR